MQHLRLGPTIAAVALVAGCGGGSDGNGGAGGHAPATSSSSSSATTGVTTVAAVASASSSGQGGNAACAGTPATIPDVTSGTVAVGTRVSLQGVVAVSRKWLISGKAHCLWGLFVSAPGLGETAAGTGLLVVSYGNDPTLKPGASEPSCAELGTDPTGDVIPDSARPGDVLDLVGLADDFPTTPTCSPPSPANQVPMRMLTSLACATLHGTASLPRPHLLTGADVTALTSTTDKAFHDAWGGVKVEVDGLGIVATGMPPAAVGPDGTIVLAGGIPVEDRVYERDYARAADVCHQAPTFKDATTVFAHVRGFHYLDGCTWSLLPEDKCSDLSPHSDDCGAIQTCP